MPANLDAGSFFYMCVYEQCNKIGLQASCQNSSTAF